MKYSAFKVEGIPHWFWFLSEKVKEENGELICTDGWGVGGALTDIKINTDKIEGHIESNTLQYE